MSRVPDLEGMTWRQIRVWMQSEADLLKDATKRLERQTILANSRNSQLSHRLGEISQLEANLELSQKRLMECNEERLNLIDLIDGGQAEEIDRLKKKVEELLKTPADRTRNPLKQVEEWQEQGRQWKAIKDENEELRKEVREVTIVNGDVRRRQGKLIELRQEAEEDLEAMTKNRDFFHEQYVLLRAMGCDWEASLDPRAREEYEADKAKRKAEKAKP